MPTNNFIAYSVKILGETVWDVLFFPFWWYSYGLARQLKNIIQFLDDRQKSLALFVWIKNIHKPMYGQEDWQGRMISLLMRLIQIFFRSLVMFFWLIAVLVYFLIWIILPFFILFQIFIVQLDMISLFSNYYSGA